VTIGLRWGAATDVGRNRANNEDSSLVTDSLFAVADGMGGHRAGEVASQIAVAALRAGFDEATTDGLREAVRHANEAVYSQGMSDPDLRGMGTTLVAVAVVDTEVDGDGEQIAFANVGDSRIYLLRDGELEQLTDDHTVVDEMVREGRLDPVEAETHPQRHIITRALGIDEDVAVDAGEVTPFVGDRFLLCSDGLSNEVDTARMASVLRRIEDPTDAANELVRLALENGGRDNITVVLVDVVDDGDRALAAARSADKSGIHRDPDLAGFTTAGERADNGRAAAATKAEGRPKRAGPRPKRFTWRVTVFVLAIVVVLAGAAGTVGWYARHTYYVGFDGDEVVVYKGRPGGVLWFDPTVEQRTGIDRADVPPSAVPRLRDGVQEGSAAEAESYVRNLQDDISPTTSTTATSSTTSTSSTTTTTTTLPTGSTVPGN
jgi:protein phosphatase